MEEDDKG